MTQNYVRSLLYSWNSKSQTPFLRFYEDLIKQKQSKTAAKVANNKE